MSASSYITLPPDLLPSDGRFGSGPSKIPTFFLEGLADTQDTLLGTSHRRPAVKDLVRVIRERLTELFQLPDGYEVALGNGGATLFWDMAVHSLIKSSSEHLVFGEFSSKFASAARQAPFIANVKEVKADYGSCPSIEEIEGVDTYALTHNETSTGVLAPLSRPQSADALVLVDATSAAGAVPVDPQVFDAYYFSPQKAFASEGGLWVALLSPQAVSRAVETVALGRYVPTMLDLSVAIENSRENQTYNTPAIATLYLMNAQLEWILSHGGLAWATQRSADSASILYRWADAATYAHPFVADPALRSPVIATIDFDENIDAKTIAATLRANGIVDTEPYRKLGRNQLRIALFPSIDPDDVEALTQCIDFIVGRL
ncbi:MAG: phosphoserine transaminase [Ferrimicrobium sp.]|jgi:phosphoserine aminotransferase|uniref:Phosphoserine aminotransferase n=1 Tax=Ferrimicrobium acidiphilum TaxID=121039 RepID=A0ABV3Y174_9ACTN|nr:phosphoserine transaminase [Ferrimicrobium sp.]MCL5973543.1 phosphoserine transaminase [Actinomycetota bacterium]